MAPGVAHHASRFLVLAIFDASHSPDSQPLYSLMYPLHRILSILVPHLSENGDDRDNAGTSKGGIWDALPRHQKSGARRRGSGDDTSIDDDRIDGIKGAPNQFILSRQPRKRRAVDYVALHAEMFGSSPPAAVAAGGANDSDEDFDPGDRS